MGVGVDVVQPYPCPERPQITRQIGDMCAVATVFGMFDIDAVGRGILRDHQQLVHAVLHQLFSLAQDRMGRARLQAAAHVGDDAELALVITAFRDLQIAVVARRQADGLRGQQIDKRIGRGRHGPMHRVQHLFILVRAGDGQNTRVMFADIIRLGPQTAGHDHLAIFVQRLANRVKAFGLGGIKEPAGVHNHRIRPGVVRRHAVAFGAQPRQNPFAVDQRLGAAQRYHADGRLAGAGRIADLGLWRKIGA